MRSLRIYLGIGVLLLIVYVVAQYNRPKAINWETTYYYKDKIPFGTYVLYSQLPQLFPGAKVTKTNESLYEIFHGHHYPQSNYLIVASQFSRNSDPRGGKSEYEELVKYIQQGNSVFVSAEKMGGTLIDTLKISTDVELKEKSMALNFTNVNLKRATDYKLPHQSGETYFDSFDTTKAVSLAKNANGKSTLLRFQFGKGTLYICADPTIFGNICLLDKDGAEYAAKVLSYLPKVKNIYWDEYQNADIPVDESPVRVFFSNPYLTWAYGIAFISLIVFILYEMKRRQRIIPVIEPLKNTTVDFVNVVGQVYYEQRDNQNIVQKKIMYFMEHLRTTYYLKTGTLNKDFIEKLVQKTGVDETFANELVAHINYLATGRYVSDQELITLNQQIEKFYNLTT